MIPITDQFETTYEGCTVVYGRGRTAELGERLEARGHDNALIVCGTHVGANDALMDPIRAGLGDRHAGTVDETTGRKRIETAFSALAAAATADADVLVAVGGGSSLDVARQASVFAADDRSLDALLTEAQSGSVRPPTADPALPVVVIPTTVAGADLSAGGSLEVCAAADSPTGQPILVRAHAMPIIDLIDPALFETTPRAALAGSAMNGFNKGIETLYARDHTPVSDATALHGLRLLTDALPVVAGDPSQLNTASEAPTGVSAPPSPEAAMDRVAAGALLVQIDRKINVIHAFGHGFARRYAVQQGTIHAILTPHVLAALFEAVPANRRALAAGLGIDDALDADADADADAVAAAIIETVTSLRDALTGPNTLRELDAVSRDDFSAIASFVATDPPMERAPAGLEVTPEWVESVLEAAW